MLLTLKLADHGASVAAVSLDKVTGTILGMVGNATVKVGVMRRHQHYLSTLNTYAMLSPLYLMSLESAIVGLAVTRLLTSWSRMNLLPKGSPSVQKN